MNKILDWFTKKKMLIFSLFFSIFFLLSYFSINLGICFDYPNSCNNNSKLISAYTILFIPVLFFSLVAFMVNQETFSKWRNFSFYSILVFIILLSFIPLRTHGLDYLPITKSLVSLILTIIYSVVSLFLIIYQSLKK